MILFRLMFEFFKTGLFSIGGGLATLPFLYEMSEKTGWFSQHDILDMIAISESTPGAIGINMSTYVGYLTAGVPGGILATIALAAPSVIIIILIARFLMRFKDSRMINSVLNGLRPASTALIVTAGLSVAKIAFLHLDLSGWQIINWQALYFAVLLYIGLKKIKLHPAAFIVFSAVMGMLIHF